MLGQEALVQDPAAVLWMFRLRPSNFGDRRDCRSWDRSGQSAV